MEDVVLLLSHMVSKSPVISKYSWGYLSILVDIVVGLEEDLKKFIAENNSESDFQGLGFEMLDKISIIIMNYIIRDPEIFLTGTDSQNRSFLMRVLYLIERTIIIGGKKQDDLDSCHAIKLLIVLFDSLKGKIDNLLENFMKFLIVNLKTAKTIYYKIIIVQAVLVY